jgi:hypothetical protein
MAERARVAVRVTAAQDAVDDLSKNSWFGKRPLMHMSILEHPSIVIVCVIVIPSSP